MATTTAARPSAGTRNWLERSLRKRRDETGLAGRSGVCALLILSGCGAELDTADLQGTNTFAPDASVQWPYSFVQAPFVHPRIVEDLSTWLSDVGDQVVGINLLDAQGSNRYFGGFGVSEIDDGCPIVSWEPEEEPVRFSYQYIGMTESRVHVLYTTSSAGGSGVFTNLMLLTIMSDTGIDWDRQSAITRERERLVVYKLGEWVLGDRWGGALRVAGNTLTIGQDGGRSSGSGGTGGGGVTDERVLTIEIEPSGSLDFGAPEYACLATSRAQP